MSRFVNPVPQYFLDDGAVASSGRMKFFVNKDYSTLKDTYSQPNNTVENLNPLPLDGQGRLPPCFGDGLYSVKFYAYDPNEPDNLGSLQWTRDDVSLSELTGQFSDWSGVIAYNIGDIAKASNGSYYQSIQGSNLGHEPSSSPTFWSKIIFITEFNINETYDSGDIVSSGGYLYRSNVSSNVGNTPPASQWDNLTFNNSISGNFSVSGTITAGSYAGGNLSKTTDAGINVPVKKTAGTSRISTVTLAQDPDLIVTGLLASSYYRVRAFISWGGNGSTTNGISLKLNGTSITVLNVMYTASNNSSSANANSTSNVIVAGTPFSKLPAAASASEVIMIEAVIQTSLTSNLYIEWAQAASVATNTTIFGGSNMTVTKI